MISFAFILFILISFAIVLGGIYKMYGFGYTKGSILFGLGATYFAVLYGIRWFGSDQSVFATPSGSWPPVINTCPDYLTFYERVVGTTKTRTCIDRVGVSKNGALSVFPSSGPAPADDKYYFTLDLAAGGDPNKVNAVMCQKAIAAGLTWEGITNGESCIQPDGSSVSPGSSGQ
jgi:hypothetical protein